MKAPPSPAVPDLTMPTARDARDAFLARVVPGKTFVDVGGLWGTVRERVSVARDLGAHTYAMLDVAPPEDPLWAAFIARMRALGVYDCQVMRGDVHAEGVWSPREVVHCSGVLYHCPDPIRFLRALKRLTLEWCVLSSSVTESVIRTKAGMLTVPDAGWLFLPFLSPRERDILRARWVPCVGDQAIGLTRDVDRCEADDWAPWYWLPTVSALKAAARFVGFAVVDAAPIWDGNAHTLLLRMDA